MDCRTVLIQAVRVDPHASTHAGSACEPLLTQASHPVRHPSPARDRCRQWGQTRSRAAPPADGARAAISLSSEDSLLAGDCRWAHPSARPGTGGAAADCPPDPEPSVATTITAAVGATSDTLAIRPEREIVDQRYACGDHTVPSPVGVYRLWPLHEAGALAQHDPSCRGEPHPPPAQPAVGPRGRAGAVERPAGEA